MADFTIGDYQYTIRNGKACAQVVDKTKTSYADMTSTVTYNGNTYNVELGDGVTSDGCFSNCNNLTQAPKLASLATNMAGCFYNCTSLTIPPVIPNLVTNMYGCFNYCTNLIIAPDIPNLVDNLGYCFYNCINLKKVPNIPNSVTDMGYCFFRCENIVTAPAIPSAVTDTSFCFEYCFKLTGDVYVFGQPSYDTRYMFYQTILPITIKVANASDVSFWTEVATSYSNVLAEYDSSLVHIGDKINLKQLLTKIITQLKILIDGLFTYKECHEWGTQSTENIKAYNSWKNFIDFGNALSGNTSDTNYFTTNNSGFVCQKSGVYRLNASGHCNCTAGVSIAVRWYNTTRAAIVGDQRFFYDKNLTWMHYYVTSIGYINEGDTIAFQMQKYNPNNTTSYFRPSSLMTNFMYLGDEAVGERTNIEFTISDSTERIRDKFGTYFELQKPTDRTIIIRCLNNTNIKITNMSHNTLTNMTYSYVPGEKGVSAYVVGTNSSTISSVAGKITFTYEPK